MRSILFFICLIGLVLIGGQSCTRLVTKTISVTDSSAVKSLQDSIAFHKKLNEELSVQLNSAQLAGVLFDTLFVPGDTVINTVIVKDNGELIAKGKIKSAYLSRDFALKMVKDKQITIDSFSKALSEEKKNVKIVEKEVTKKTKVFVGWWLFLVGLVGGIYVGVKYKNFFIS